jgi:hypothetical protein
MSGVQVAHGGHEGHAQPLAVPGAYLLADGSDRGDGVQGSDPAGRPQKQCSGAGYSPAFTART